MLDRARAEFLDRVLSAVSSAIMLRDRMVGFPAHLRTHPESEAVRIASSQRLLAAAYVPPVQGEPAVLLCHGIGETVELWCGVQKLLREHGIGSLAFNYSGYGRSTGRVRTQHCKEDFLAAYADLQRRVAPGTRIFVLGFSLGSGIAAQGVRALQPPPAGLFLCEAFTSFRTAAHAAYIPRAITRLVPDVWNTLTNVRALALPICVVHSDADKLFPLAMPRAIAQACGERGELIVVNGLAHNEPYLHVAERYWLPIVARMRQP